MKIRSTTTLFAGTFILLPLMGCTTTALIVTGESTTSNSEAVQQAQKSIALAETRGCKAISIGSGAGVGVGVGLGKGLIIGDDCPECDHLRSEQREALEKHESIFAVHILMECPAK